MHRCFFFAQLCTKSEKRNKFWKRLPTDNGINDFSAFGWTFRLSTISRIGFTVFSAKLVARTFHSRCSGGCWKCTTCSCLVRCSSAFRGNLLINCILLAAVSLFSIVTQNRESSQCSAHFISRLIWYYFKYFYLGWNVAALLRYLIFVQWDFRL